MKTVWDYSIDSEAERLIHCARQMSVGFYRANNFIVLPSPPKAASVNIVTFPDLAYHKIPGFWEKVKHVSVDNFPLKIPSTLYTQLFNLIKNSDIKKPEFEQVKSTWAKAENKVIKEIERILPGKTGLIKKITIHPTSFGTSSSFNLIDNRGEVIIYLRDDRGIHTITEAILTSLTRAEIYSNLNGMWSESEIITDFLVTKTSIAKVLVKFEKGERFTSTIKGVRTKQNAKLITLSENYYQKLGIPASKKIFSLNGLTPEVYKKPVAGLSLNEKQILKILIEKNDVPVTFDDVSTVMFKSDDDFSLQAIAKQMERLRKKLEENGISGSYIQTLRGKGYLLKN